MDHQGLNATPQSSSNRQNSNNAILPSPTSSESIASSDSHLCTPVSSAGLGHSLQPPITQEIQAANSAFFSFAGYGDAQDADKMTQQDSESLSSAFDFGGPMFTMNDSSNSGNSSTDHGNKSSGHSRTDSASRRHSAQPILSDHSALGGLDFSFDGLPRDGATSFDFLAAHSNGTTSTDEYDFMADFTNEDQAQVPQSQHQNPANSFFSPPRLTVSLSNEPSGQPSHEVHGADSPKRVRRALEPEETPLIVKTENVPMSRSAGQSPNMPPPPPKFSFETPQRAGHVQNFLPNGHRNSDASTMTPYSDKTASSVMDSVMGSVSSTASDRRRLSIDNQGGSPGRDRLAAQANMLGITSMAQSIYDLPAPPKSAPPNSSFNAMQRAQSISRRELAEREVAKAGKGADVWPDDVEVAFWEALRLIPKLGRRKVLVNGKPCGRNELIADYILRKTDKQRSRKQVSSHIQVLKNIKKDDLEFQSLIAEPVQEEDFYMPAGGMMYVQTLAGYGYGGLGGPEPMFADSNAGLLSPYSPFANNRALPPASPMGLAADLNNPPLSAGGGITAAFGNMGLPSPGARISSAAACPILPSTFSMCVSCSDSEEVHYYTKLDYESMAPYSQADSHLPRLPLDAPRMGSYRFPRLAEMFQRMPCQFLHVSVPMAIPRQDILLPKFNRFTTQLSMTSHTDRQLTSITTVYSFGKRILSLYESLDPPCPLAAARQGRKSGGETPTPGNATGLSSPLPPQASDDLTPKEEFPSESSAAQSTGSSSPHPRHMYRHQAPFATDFWADFLSRQHPVQWNQGHNSRQAFCKEPSERAALGMAVGGVTIIQELVVANGNRAGSEMTNGHGVLSDAAHTPAHISPGSYVGDVVLVIAWDLECVEKLGTSPGKPIVSHICEPVHRNVSPMVGGQQRLAYPPPQQQFAGYSMSTPQTHRVQMAQSSPLANTTPLSPLMQGPPQPVFNANTLSSSNGPSLLRKRGLSGAKAHLSLNIPPATSHLNPNRTIDASPRSAQPSPNALGWGLMQRHGMMGVNSPITPATGIAGTPLAPPPMPSEEESKPHRERLNRQWAKATAQDFHSPVVSTFHLPQGEGLHGDDMMAAARKQAFHYPHLQNQQMQQLQYQQMSQQQHLQPPQQQQMGMLHGENGGGSLGLSFDSDRSVAGGGMPPNMFLPVDDSGNGLGHGAGPDSMTQDAFNDLLRSVS